MKKWKWIYKLIFTIAIVPLSLFMLSKKEVKALEQGYSVVIKTQYYQHYLEPAQNAYTYEYIAQYVIEGIIINNINENEYFFITEKYIPLRKGINRNANTYEIDGIEIGSNFTIFSIRMTLNKNFVDSEYPYGNLWQFFFNDSAFYIQYDVYSLGYADGYELGREEGYTNGYNDGYTKGSEYGYEVGYNIGFDNGVEAGYDEGYIIGRDEGYQNGYLTGWGDGWYTGYVDGRTEGYLEGYEDGKEYGINFGREHWYDVGYQAGYNAGINEQLADKDFSNLLRGVFVAIGAFLGINLLPGISIGAIIAVPIVFGIIAFILGRKKD